MDANERKLEWSLIASVTDPRVLHNTLLRSPVVDERCEVILKRYFANAGEAYNAAIDQATRDVLVFAHQDVYLPAGWTDTLARVLAELERIDPEWGVLGAVGIDWQGELRGHVYSVGLGAPLGEPFEGFHEAASLDEMLLIVRRGSGLRFDPSLPDYHLYGTDICLEARRRGLSSYVAPLYCLHNSNGLRGLPREFWSSYLYMRRKWRAHLPIETCCTRITRGCWPMLRRAVRDLFVCARRGVRIDTRHDDPETLYRELAERAGRPAPAGAGR